MQSSAISLAIVATQSGRSLMNYRKRSGPSTVPLGTPLLTVAFSDVAPSTMTCCVRPARKDLIHSRVPDSIMVELSQKSLMWGTIKGFGNGENHTVHLPCKFMYQRQQLSLAAPPGTETLLTICQNLVIL